MTAASTGSSTTAWSTIRSVANRWKNSAALAAEQPEKFLRIARPRTAPRRLPAIAGRRYLRAARMDQQPRAVGPRRCANPRVVIEHRPLRLGKTARRHAARLLHP